MRLLLAFAAAQSLGLFLAPCDAFSPSGNRCRRDHALPTTATTTTTTSSLNAGSWDNDDFLESLAGKNPAAPRGDDDLPRKDIDGATLSPEMKEKMKKAAEEDEFAGGTRFKKLLEAAQKANPSMMDDELTVSLKNPFADNPFAGIEGLDPTVSSSSSLDNINPDELTVEQQAELFRKMMQQQQQQQPPLQQPTKQAVIPPPLPRPPRMDRKVGRNRDADAIQNTADVYFAQLKRDSTVRGVARLRGDEEKANEVFQDEKIEELKNMLRQNPHLVGKREAEQKLIETAAEEMIAFQNSMGTKHGDTRTSGVSYKQKLEQMKKKRTGGGQAVAPAPPLAPEPPKAQAPPAPPVVVEQPKPEPRVVEEPKVEAPPVAEDSKVQAPPVMEAPKVEAPSAPQAHQTVQAVQPPPPPQTSLQPTHQSTASSFSPRVTAASSNEEIQKSIRTLMGLILKHRGGPGFGAGGLKGAEIAQYEQLMNDITGLLKDESKAYTGSTSTTPFAQGAAPAAAAPATTATPPPPEYPNPAVVGGLATIPSSPSTFDQVDSMLNCIDGAILMYRNAPPDLKDGVLFSIRGALLSAVNTCNKMMGQNEGIPAGSSSAGTQVDSMLACVEGAIMMYRNSPADLQGGVLMTLRAALLSAVNTCNRIIAENDMANYQQYQQATAGIPSPPSSSRPTQFYDVVQVPDEEQEVTELPPPPAAPAAAAPAATATTANSLLDENSKILENIYNTLQAAAGNGKMGLREDLTAEEASDLADGIAEMRAIMMDELANGIPTGVTSSAALGASSSDSSSTMSMYQQMLAKAKADKASNS